LKRQRTEPFDIAPVDGGVLLHPQQWVTLISDHPPARDPNLLAQTIKHIRGAILGSCVTVEHALITLEMADIYGPEVDRGKELDGFADLNRTRRAENSLNRKIDRAKAIYRKHLLKELADPIIQRMADYRELRNLMGHYPSWLEPINDDVRKLTLDFVPMIDDPTHVWTIDQTQTLEWDRLIVEVIRDATRLTFKLKGAPEPVFFANGSGLVGTLDPETGIATASPMGSVIEIPERKPR
jgi:hypothetical protein